MNLKAKLFPLLALGCFTAAARPGLAQNQTVSGKWHFVLQTEGGERTANPDFQLDGDQVTGKWDNADVKGTFKDGKLDLAFPYNSDEAGPGALKIRGELKGDTLTGTWEFQEYSGSFKATRPAPVQ
jgi:hypothetical protein